MRAFLAPTGMGKLGCVGLERALGLEWAVRYERVGLWLVRRRLGVNVWRRVKPHR
jgi:hypothetical protein